jgi:hypothetical protein
VEVRQYAVRWMSNSREPLIVAYNQKARGGALTDRDREEYLNFARSRDLEPSIEAERVFTSARPGVEPILIQVDRTGPNQFEIDVSSK